ncbi:hypothetical protein BGW39_002900 [Mortierella sp. 14UC]|nr:hypothetical protein BGW39_002900 [Mortierella sp. 14UC]
MMGLFLKITLAVMAVSTVIRGLHLVRILLAGFACTFALCYLRRMRKAMTKDLESRITSLVGSTSYRGRNGSQASHSGMSARHDTKALSQDQQQQQQSMNDNTFQVNSSISVSFVSEKSADGPPQSTPELNRNGHSTQNAQDVFYQIDLEQPSYRQTAMDSPAERPLTPGFSLYPPSSDTVPLVTISSGERNHHYPQPAYPQPSQPVYPVTTTSNNTSGLYLTAPHNSNYSIHSQQQTGSFSEDTVQRSTINQLGPNNRLAALSFYDDLLKSISSERMIYANQAMVDVRQSIHGPEDDARRQSHHQSATSPSMVPCSSIPLTYSGDSEYDDRHSTERPVHPFDIVPCQSRFPTPGTEQDIAGAIADIYMHPLDLMDLNGGLEINLQSQPGSQESLHATSFRNLRRASRCGSPHSQETIENWRIHVAPSSPVIPEIEFDMQDTHQRRDPTTPTPTGGRYDGYSFKDMERGPDSRRGTIPIILSSHLQEAAAMYQEDGQDYHDTADDLHIPRPFYAYGQGRSQRQGSIQSSVGGYNYSTAASSPSLADSLSNPMYQQQDNGIMNATGFPCTFPPRKGSLPCSISSSILEDVTTPRGSQFAHQQPSTLGQISYLSANTALPIRTRPRARSHLSNMVNHTDGPIGDAETTQTVDTVSFQAKRGHARSQSQGSHSTGNRGSSWDQLRAFKEAQAGYATLIDLPATSTSHMGYQAEADDDDFMLRESVRMSIKAGMSLKEALEIDNIMYRNSMQRPQGSQHVLAPSFNGEIDDKMVHPLDLSPLLLQTRSGPQQQQIYGYAARHSPVTHGLDSSAAAQLAWDETCIGLGLTMATATYCPEPQQNYNHPFSTEGYSLPRRPIPVRHHHLDNNDSSTSQEQHHQQRQRRPDMAPKSSTSGLTTHTLHSDATLTSGAYAATTTSSAVTTSSTFVDMTFTDPPYSSRPSMSSSSLLSQQRISDHEQDATHTTHTTHTPRQYGQYYQYSQQQQQQYHQQQHPQQKQLDQQYSFSQRSVGGHGSNSGEPQEFPFYRSRDYNNNYQQQQPVQRQPSQRNKKNLVVNITPPSQMF